MHDLELDLYYMSCTKVNVTIDGNSIFALSITVDMLPFTVFKLKTFKVDKWKGTR